MNTDTAPLSLTTVTYCNARHIRPQIHNRKYTHTHTRAGARALFLLSLSLDPLLFFLFLSLSLAHTHKHNGTYQSDEGDFYAELAGKNEPDIKICRQEEKRHLS